MRLGRYLRGAIFASAIGLVSVVPMISSAADSSFPFDRELVLDAPPMKGSKRMPIIEVATNGTAEIGLWCNSVRGQVIVVSDTITILPGPRTENQCAPERSQGDDDILSALTEMTNWRWDGDRLILTGARTLRFRLQTN
jgi:heat shock protein HslJ